MDKKPKVIIIKKYKKNHGGHHGGSWKVAYADFVTAMMAFFLLMWLLSMVSPEKRAVMSQYFKNFSLFEHGGKSFMMEGGVKPAYKSGGQEHYDTQDPSVSGVSEEDDLKGMLLAGVENKAESLQGSVLVDVSEEGVRIQIVDRKENPIFPVGSAALTDEAKRVLSLVATSMKNLPNQIIIEGHTDTSRTRSEQISNWELSTLRACSARRRSLENCGIDPFRISRVAGYADKVPLIKEDPTDPRNRRISIVFLFNKKKKLKDPYDWVWNPSTANL